MYVYTQSVYTYNIQSPFYFNKYEVTHKKHFCFGAYATFALSSLLLYILKYMISEFATSKKSHFAKIYFHKSVVLRNYVEINFRDSTVFDIFCDLKNTYTVYHRILIVSYIVLFLVKRNT